MANITTFATLKSEILALIGRAPRDPVYQAVTSEINRDMRLKVMEKEITLSAAEEISLAPTITGATQANPCVITAVAHQLPTGSQVTISGVVGMTELNNNTYTITNVSADTFSLDNTDSSAFTAYTSGGIATLSFLGVQSIYRDSTPQVPLEVSAANTLRRDYVAANVPTRYALIDGKILLDGTGGSDSIILRYFEKLTHLSADEDLNDVLLEHPDIYLYGSLYHHALLTGDERVAAWKMAYDQAKRLATASDQASRHSGAPLVPLVESAD